MAFPDHKFDEKILKRHSDVTNFNLEGTGARDRYFMVVLIIINGPLYVCFILSSVMS